MREKNDEELLFRKRMVQALTYLAPLAAILLVVSCSRNKVPASPGPSMAIVPGTGVGPIKFGLEMDEVKKILGEPDNLTGRSLSYSRLGLAIVPSAQDGTVAAVFIGGSGGLAGRFTGSTEEGVKLKSTRQDVLAAYGRPEYAVTDPDGTEHLRYNSRKLEFALRDGKVFWIAVKG